MRSGRQTTGDPSLRSGRQTTGDPSLRSGRQTTGDPSLRSGRQTTGDPSLRSGRQTQKILHYVLDDKHRRFFTMFKTTSSLRRMTVLFFYGASFDSSHASPFTVPSDFFTSGILF